MSIVSKEYLILQYRNFLLDLKLGKLGSIDALKRTVELATLMYGFRFADELRGMSDEYGI